jgi:hypothetical protein
MCILLTKRLEDYRSVSPDSTLDSLVMSLESLLAFLEKAEPGQRLEITD